MSTEQTTSTSLTVDQLNEIIKKMGGYEGALRLLQGESEVKPVAEPIIIDCDVNPFCHNESIVRHHRNGQFIFNPSKIELLPWERGVSYEDFMRELPKDIIILNANVYDYLLKHPRLIPESWECDDLLYVAFLGTVFSNYIRGNINYYYHGLCWSYNHHFERRLWEDCAWGFNRGGCFVPVARVN